MNKKSIGERTPERRTNLMPGFIQDKLEIKFLILYIAARVREPVPFDTTSPTAWPTWFARST